jgi:hypothetical protein
VRRSLPPPPSASLRRLWPGSPGLS